MGKVRLDLLSQLAHEAAEMLGLVGAVDSPDSPQDGAMRQHAASVRYHAQDGPQRGRLDPAPCAAGRRPDEHQDNQGKQAGSRHHADVDTVEACGRTRESAPTVISTAVAEAFAAGMAACPRRRRMVLVILGLRQK